MHGKYRLDTRAKLIAIARIPSGHRSLACRVVPRKSGRAAKAGSTVTMRSRSRSQARVRVSGCPGIWTVIVNESLHHGRVFARHHRLPDAGRPEQPLVHEVHDVHSLGGFGEEHADAVHQPVFLARNRMFPELRHSPDAAHGDGVRLDQAADRGPLAGEVPPDQVEGALACMIYMRDGCRPRLGSSGCIGAVDDPASGQQEPRVCRASVRVSLAARLELGVRSRV